MQDDLCKSFSGGSPLRVDIEKRKTDKSGTSAVRWEQARKDNIIFKILFWISAASENSSQSDVIYQLNAFVSFRFYINVQRVSKLTNPYFSAKRLHTPKAKFN